MLRLHQTHEKWDASRDFPWFSDAHAHCTWEQNLGESRLRPTPSTEKTNSAARSVHLPVYNGQIKNLCFDDARSMPQQRELFLLIDLELRILRFSHRLGSEPKYQGFTRLVIVALVICLCKMLSKTGNVIRVSVHTSITHPDYGGLCVTGASKRFKLLLVTTSCLR